MDAVLGVRYVPFGGVLVSDAKVSCIFYISKISTKIDKFVIMVIFMEKYVITVN